MGVSRRSPPESESGSTSFAPDCVNSTIKPIVYHIDSFITSPDTGMAGKFSAFPQAVKSYFEKTLKSSFDLLTIRAANQGSGTAGKPLFDKRNLDTISQVPPILNCGDIVLGFTYTGKYDYDRKDFLIKTNAVSDDKRIAEFHGNKWKNDAEKMAREKLSVANRRAEDFPPMKLPEIGDEGGSSFPVFNKQFTARPATFLSVCIGVVNVAHPISRALYVFDNAKPILKDAREILIKSDFAPSSIVEISKKAKDLQTAYFEAIGRGLAYTTLHEFWHCAEQNPIAHPYFDGDSIMGTANAKNLDENGQPLTLKPAVPKILAKYKADWCDCITKRIVSVDKMQAR